MSKRVISMTVNGDPGGHRRQSVQMYRLCQDRRSDSGSSGRDGSDCKGGGINA